MLSRELKKSTDRIKIKIEKNDSKNSILSTNSENNIWLNKNESEKWNGDLPLDQYPINEDSDPELIIKKNDKTLFYDQEISIRYLKPETPSPPGEIIIIEEKNIVTEPAPPLVIRQEPPRPVTPSPLVIREAPPPNPPSTKQKKIIIPGKKVVTPPRKVIIEKLPQLPPKPQPVVIERWLPYEKRKCKIVYEPAEPEPVVEKPRNLIIEWDTPKIIIKKEYKNLGVIRADPDEYMTKYGHEIKDSNELNKFVKQLIPSEFETISKREASPVFELEGDIEALKLVDLDNEGLSAYRKYIEKPISKQESNNEFIAEMKFTSESPPNEDLNAAKKNFDDTFLNYFLANSFAALDPNGDLKIRRRDGIKLFKRLNRALKLNNTKEEIRAFICSFDRDNDGYINFNDFKNGVTKKLISHEELIENDENIRSRFNSDYLKLQDNLTKQSISRSSSAHRSNQSGTDITSLSHNTSNNQFLSDDD